MLHELAVEGRRNGYTAGGRGALDERSDLLAFLVGGRVVPCPVPSLQDFPQQDLSGIMIAILAATGHVAQRRFDIALFVLELYETVSLGAERIHLRSDFTERGFLFCGEGAALGLCAVDDYLALFVGGCALFEQLLCERCAHGIPLPEMTKPLGDRLGAGVVCIGEGAGGFRPAHGHY
ncbi:hypothetical protein D3C73_1105080 [compost metagenome]